MAVYASTIEGLSQIATSAEPDLILSDQAIYVLETIEKNAASKLYRADSISAGIILSCDTSRGNMELSEPRFIDDDLDRLVLFGLLSEDYSDRSSVYYKPTRLGSKLAQESLGTLDR